MAVELGLHKYVAQPPAGESEYQRLERKNRERTYLVLFIYDRSLMLRTGRDWMLPPKDLVMNVERWQESHVGGSVRPEDILVSATVELRRFSADMMDWLHTNKTTATDAQVSTIIASSTERFARWQDQWSHQLERGKPTCHHEGSHA
jgi:hypothetical protein